MGIGERRALCMGGNILHVVIMEQLPVQSRNKLLCDGDNNMIAFIFEAVRWNLTQWKLEAYACREFTCL